MEILLVLIELLLFPAIPIFWIYCLYTKKLDTYRDYFDIFFIVMIVLMFIIPANAINDHVKGLFGLFIFAALLTVDCSRIFFSLLFFATIFGVVGIIEQIFYRKTILENFPPLIQLLLPIIALATPIVFYEWAQTRTSDASSEENVEEIKPKEEKENASVENSGSGEIYPYELYKRFKNLLNSNTNSSKEEKNG